ncbi:MAG: hypothetical protein ACMG51_04310 [Ginsengibacter sp.]
MKYILFLFVWLSFSGKSFGQQITYSESESNDLRTLNFEIIGKIHQNFLVYKNIRNDIYISVMDARMNQVNKTYLSFMPEKTLNVDFVVYPDFAWLIYQYQRRNIVYCMAVKINDQGKLMTDPFELDTTSISFFANNKIYSTIKSEDKSRIMVYKIQKKNDRFNYTTLLFNDSLKLLEKKQILTTFDDRKNIFSDFFVTNKGTFVFTKGNKSVSRDFIDQLDLVTKPTNQDTFSLTPFSLDGNLLDEIKLKVDNQNGNYLVNSFYYAKRRGNVEGLYTAVFSESDNALSVQKFLPIGDSLRQGAKSEGNNRTAMNDFFIRDVTLKKDGGFIITSEDYYSQGRSNPWNRYDYLYGSPYYSPYYYNYSSPYSYGYYNNRSFNSSQVRYYYNNLLVLSMSARGDIEWSNVVHKSQYDDDNDNYLSYALMLTGGQLHYLFNEMQRRNQMLNDQSITGDGKLNRNPPLRGLDRGYEFMSRYGQQVSANEIIIPCTYRNYIVFAKIEY